jgi:glycosyltransferase-like protein
MPLRIGLLTHSVNPRGGVVHTVELAEALQAAGHDVTVMAPAAPGQRLFRELRCAVDLIEVPGGTADTAQMIHSRIAAYLRHLSAALTGRHDGAGFDVLHAQDGIGGNALAELCERSLIRGFIRTVHHVDRFGDPAIDALQARAIRCAREVVCVSDLWRLALEAEYGVSATVIGNGVNRRRFTPESAADDLPTALRLGLRPGAPLIACVGGIEQRKNTVRILQAFQILKCRLPQSQLAVVGGASLLDHSRYRRAFEAALRTSGLCVGPGGDVVITGPVGDEEMPAIMRLADAIAFPSVSEGFGLVALEALACGTPTVVSRIAPFTEYLRDGDVQWADPFDVASIAAALSAALAQRRFAPPAVCERHGWGTCAVCHIALYRRFLDPKVSHLDSQVSHLDSQVSNRDSQVSNRDSQVSHFDSQVSHFDSQVLL